jgi:hypothetical protein
MTEYERDGLTGWATYFADAPPQREQQVLCPLAVLMHAVRKVIPLFALGLVVGCDGGVFLTGRVLNSDGVPVKGAKVHLTTSGDGWPLEAETDTTGCFDAGGATAPGHYQYRVRVEARGYESAEGRIQTIQKNYVVVTLELQGSGRSSQVLNVPADPCDSSQQR